MGFKLRFMGAALAALLFTMTAGCLLPPSPAERLSYSAHEMNSATRFGRMDVALMHVAAKERGAFARRHRQWHRNLRIVDVDLEGMQMLGKGAAEVLLVISWHRLNETTIRNSTIAQRWTHEDGDWRLQSELRAAGSPGLFVAPVLKKRNAKKPVASDAAKSHQVLTGDML